MRHSGVAGVRDHDFASQMRATLARSDISGYRARPRLPVAQNIHHLELGERCPMKRVFISIAAAAVVAVAASAASAQTLKTVQSRGMLNCGGNGALGGFGLPDAQGNWTGLDVDFCRAVAAAIFNDANKVKFVALNAKDRFTALQSGDVDLLVRNTTWTSSRDTSLGLNFTGINYFDGQGFMVR